MSGFMRFYPRELAGLQDEVERMFRDFVGSSRGGETTPATAGAWSPALDVEETADAFVLHVELPGVNPEDVEVNLEESVLTVTGERRFYGEREAEGFHRVERRFGRFHRAVRLPDRVDPMRVEATYDNGLLTILVPKAEEAKPRRIQVRPGSSQAGVTSGRSTAGVTGGTTGGMTGGGLGAGTTGGMTGGTTGSGVSGGTTRGTTGGIGEPATPGTSSGMRPGTASGTTPGQPAR